MVEQLLEARVAQLEEELSELRERLVLLEEGVASGAQYRPKKLKRKDGDAAAKSEELLSWAGRASLLPRIATICFVMVLALALRTIADNDLINQQVGTLLGVMYAAVLIGNGWYLYRRESVQAPVLTACGAFLMFSIVVETQARFKSLPPVPAYLVLMATGGALSYLSHKFQRALPVIAGTLVMCLGGVVIDYPSPIFSYLSPLLLFANLLAFFATHIKRCSWLRWFVLIVTVFMMQLWGFKLGIYLVKELEPPGPLALHWFYPILALFGATFIASSSFGIMRTEGRISKFDFAVPTLNAIWTFWVADYVIFKAAGEPIGLGVISMAVAVAHFWIATGLGGYNKEGAPGTNSFVLAGAVWLAEGMGISFDNQMVALPVFAGVAVWLALSSQKWLSGGVRASSYLLQAYACGVMIWLLHEQPAGQSLAWTVVATGAMALLGIYHYRWCRRTPPPSQSEAFAKDRQDRGAILVLLAGLVAGFYQARALLYLGLHYLPGNQEHTFICAQSILINGSVVVLMVLALRYKSRELRNIAILVTLIGAGKVFMIGLLSTKGIPLVLSVLSFGLVASVESLILTRWQKIEKGAASGGQVPA